MAPTVNHGWKGYVLTYDVQTLPAPFDVLKFDILTRETVFFYIESGRGQGFFKRTLTGSPQFSLPIVIGSVAISLLARVFRSSVLLNWTS